MATTKSSVSRRDAMKGAVGIGLAASATLGASTVARAQEDATPTAMSNHPVVGVWSLTDPAGYVVFHADGTYAEVNPLGPGNALGIWRATGDYSVEVVQVFPNATPDEPAPTPLTAWWSAELDPDGNRMETEAVFQQGEAVGSTKTVGTRLTFESTPKPE